MNNITPNTLSWSRIIIAPLIVLFYFIGNWGAVIALLLFIFAAITDYYDGKLARLSNNVNPFGTFLDPVADKILVTIVLLMLLIDPHPEINRILLGIVAALIILREIFVSSLRDWMAQKNRTTEVAVTGLSKTKTALQLTGIIMILCHDPLAWFFKLLKINPTILLIIPYVGIVVLVAAAIVGIITAKQYAVVAFK